MNRTKALSFLAALVVAICSVTFVGLPASAAPADITGTWELTIHYPPCDGDFVAT